MHCPQCGADNPPEYRFCGMCGTPLAKKETPVLESVSVRREPANRTERSDPFPVRAGRDADEVDRDSAPRRVEREPAPIGSLSGPSFLGLGSEPAHGNGRSDEDVSYLLDDEDVRPRRTYWRFLLLLIILGIVGGLFYLQYRKEGRSWVAPWSNQKPQTPVQASQTQSQQPAANPSTNQPPANPAPATNGASPAPGNSQGQEQSNPPASANDSGSNNSTAQNSNEFGTATQPSKAESAPDQTETAKAEPPSATKEPSDTTDTGEAAQPAKRVRATKPKPTRPLAPAVSPDDALVANAEKYLYGRGVPQNCDRALTSLRSAADRSNNRARTLLGTMYATGHCVPKDLPNAYRWFALASRTSPDNMWVQRNLEMIWREMTPQERQIATRSQ